MSDVPIAVDAAGVWYDEPETFEERQARTDRMGHQTSDTRSLPFARIVDRAYDLAKPHMRRAPRGIAMPFGIEHRALLSWRLSPDVRYVLLREWPTDPMDPISIVPAETLFGIRLDIDYKAPEGTLELVDAANDAVTDPAEAPDRA